MTADIVEKVREAERAIGGADLSGIDPNLAKRIVTLKKWTQDLLAALEAKQPVAEERIGLFEVGSTWITRDGNTATVTKILDNDYFQAFHDKEKCSSVHYRTGHCHQENPPKDLIKIAKQPTYLSDDDFNRIVTNKMDSKYDYLNSEMHPTNTDRAVDLRRIANQFQWFMDAVAALGQPSGYNGLTYFDTPILNLPTQKLADEVQYRWKKLNDTGVVAKQAIQDLRDYKINSAALTSAPSVPDGWQLVPKKPTDAMYHAGQLAKDVMFSVGAGLDTAHFPSGAVYQAMLAAAPQPPAKEDLR